jgi:hypothetical protein
MPFSKGYSFVAHYKLLQCRVRNTTRWQIMLL